MKTTYFLFFLILTALTACSEKKAQKDVPFEMMPEGLKKSVKAELIEQMKKEVIAGHEELHKFYLHFPPPACSMQEWRNTLQLNRNAANKILINTRINLEGSIEKSVITFYLANEALTSEKTRHLIQDHNYRYNHLPFYSHVNREEILEQIHSNKIELNLASNNKDKAFFDFYFKALKDWENKLLVIETLGLKELKEIHPQAHIQIRDALNEEGLSPLTIEAFEGIIAVRDYASRKYFNLPYMDLYFQGTRYMHPDSEAKLAAINHLYRVNIIDHSYAKANNLLTDWQWEEPEFIP